MRAESSHGAETALRRDCAEMKHTRLGYWIEEAGDVTPRPPLGEDRDADVLIVGGGYTGMWTAWHARALAPEARIVILESEPVCGRGPSGRNGGFVEGMWTHLASMRDRWGDAPALAVGRRRRGGGAPRRRLLHRRRGSTPGTGRRGYLEVSTAPAQDGAGHDAVDACRELGVRRQAAAWSPPPTSAPTATRPSSAPG